ncbi:hypothetical protein C8Q78DRAFT_474849 [Trametes maxima]|nr:hypothetical protein C8Q78DRAFT_474849 [Trametes maxima]
MSALFSTKTLETIFCSRCGLQCDSSTYIQTFDGSGRHCCDTCTQYYKDKIAGMAQAKQMGVTEPSLFTSVVTTTPEAPSSVDIEKNSTSARRGTGQHIPVQRVGPTSPVQLRVPGLPNVPNKAPPTAPSRSSAGTHKTGGYTSSHALYAATRSQVASRAYAKQVVPQVTIQTALHSRKGDGKSGTDLIRDIEEGVVVPVNILEDELKQLIFARLSFRWNKYYPQTPLDINELEFVNDKLVPQASGPCLEDVFYRIPVNAKSPERRFYPNTTVKLRLLVSRQMLFDAKQARGQHEDSTVAHSDDHLGDDKSRGPALGVSEPAGMSANAGGDDSASGETQPRKRIKTAAVSRGVAVEARAYSAREDQPVRDGDAVVHKPQLKSSFPHKIVDLSMHGAGQVQSEPARPTFLPRLDFSAMSRALKAQQALRGSTSDDAIASRILAGAPYVLYPVPIDSITTILENCDSGPFDVISINRREDGQSFRLAVNDRTSAMLGRAGSFKTAHPATLFVDRVATGATNAAGAVADMPWPALFKVGTRVDLAAKRAFFRDNDAKDDKGCHISPRKRYAQKDEIAKMIIEANCLYWASALMERVYQFIDSVTQAMEPGTPPHIPRMRFVQAGLAVPAASVTDAVYLLEERIMDTFVKYVPNSKLAPAHNLDNEEHQHIAQFLCTAQHIQYLETGGMAIVSDFQGGSSLLTDPQIMTTDDYRKCFGLGNLPRILPAFEGLHQCNIFCRFLGLSPFTQVTGKQGGGAEA